MSSGRCSDTCCSTSQICFNGGKCQAKCLQSGKRFKCACPDGFTGNRCEIKPRSCAPYIYSSNDTDGLRLIYAPDNTTYLVFCHFDVNTYSIRSDTLVMSYANSNKELFEKQSLKNDFSYQNKPNWLKYRLSLERMKALRDESTYWTFTCAYDTRGFLYRDYLRVKFEKCDILTHTATLNERTIEVTYVNIRGSDCRDCELNVGQGTYIFHVYKFGGNGWEGYPTKMCDTVHAQYFGRYACVDTSFVCMASSTSTTQLWFTNYLQP